MSFSDPAAKRLDELRPFAHCTHDELDFIADRLMRIEAPAGNVLMHEGEVDHEVVVLVDGVVTVEVGGHTVASLGPGEIFGEMLHDGRPRSATVVAASPIVAEVCDSDSFAEILEEVPSLSLVVLDTVERHVRAAAVI
jgi:CRP/FNR family cyclic AMP-dependent transcriptional regulator